MFTVGPIVVILLFYLSFVLWLKFLTKGKEIKVIREEQLYNRSENKPQARNDQRDPVKREERSSLPDREEEEEDRDYGIV
jgi:hypothetical protein